MPGFNKADYTAAYNKANYQSYTIRFNVKSEADLIRRIQEEGSAKEYIARLIRADIKARKRKDPLQVTGRGAAGTDHDNLREYPVEVLEMLPGGGAMHIAYCIDMDTAIMRILIHCDKGCPKGEIMIAKRDVLRHDLKYLKKGTVYAKK